MSNKKKIIFTLATILIFFLCIEAGLRLASFIKNDGENPRLQFSIYKDKPWIKEVYQDYASVDIKFSRYVHYKAIPVSSKYVNTDSNGIRNTWNPTFPANSKIKKIFVFGGSTAFGWVDTRDDYTIPSLISKFINTKDSDKYFVSNYAQPAYSFNQEIIKLIFLLREGYRPSQVVFYGGYNDVLAAYEGNDPDAFLSEGWIKEKLEASDSRLISFVLKNFIRDNCKTCVLLTDLVRKISPGFGRVADIKGFSLDDNKLESLSKEIKDGYAKSLALLDNLSTAYGFKYIVVWQPSLFLETNFTGDEVKLKDLDWRMKDLKLSQLYKYTNEQIKSLSSKNLFDLSRVLRDRKEQLYLDSVHVTEDGNSILAEKIIDIIKSKPLK